MTGEMAVTDETGIINGILLPCYGYHPVTNSTCSYNYFSWLATYIRTPVLSRFVQGGIDSITNALSLYKRL